MKSHFSGRISHRAFSILLGLSGSMLSSSVFLPPGSFAQIEKVGLPAWHGELYTADDPNLSAGQREQSYARAIEFAKTSKQPDQYPLQACLLSRAVFFLNNQKFDEAEKDFREAIRLAEASLTKLWSETASAEEKASYLPAYSNKSQEKEGKLHIVSNLKQWLSQVLYEKKQFDEAMRECDESFKILNDNKIEGTVLRIRLNLLKVNLLEAVGREREGMPFMAEADRLRKTLAHGPR